MKTFFTKRKVWGGKGFFLLRFFKQFEYVSKFYYWFCVLLLLVSVLLDIYCLEFSESLGYVPFLLLENPLTLFFYLFSFLTHCLLCSNTEKPGLSISHPTWESAFQSPWLWHALITRSSDNFLKFICFFLLAEQYTLSFISAEDFK